MYRSFGGFDKAAPEALNLASMPVFKRRKKNFHFGGKGKKKKKKKYKNKKSKTKRKSNFPRKKNPFAK